MFKEAEYELAKWAKEWVIDWLNDGFTPQDIMSCAREMCRFYDNDIRTRGMIAAVFKAGDYDPYTGQWWMPPTVDVLKWYKQSKRAESKRKRRKRGPVVSCFDAMEGRYFNEQI